LLKLSKPNISDAAIDEVVDVLRSGQLVHGKNCIRFERDLATYLDCHEVIVVSSGTAALHLSLLALGIGEGDAVLVPDFTFPATANVVEISGATAVIVDVEPDSYVMSPASLSRAIANWDGPETLKAIMPVHEFGCPVDIDAILSIAKTAMLAVIEDAACALGAEHNGSKVGTLGDLGCFSFHPRKTLTTGEGGAIATNDPELARSLCLYRDHGINRGAQGAVFEHPGLNYRLTDFQAALGRNQLADMESRIAARRKLADYYFESLTPLVASGDVRLPMNVPGHSWQTFMTVLSAEHDRDAVIKRLRNLGVEASLGAHSISSLGIYRNYRSAEPLPHGSLLYHRGLALPFYEQMTMGDVDCVTEALEKSLVRKMKRTAQ
jgi:dTDP-4-amino-4,6-dideoxygalactose transaminase